jgi:uncharacterized phage-associated protein
MSYLPNTVASRFTRLAAQVGEQLTPMQLQKLTYIAHGFKLALSAGTEPLINEDVAAWKFGPVIPSLYHQLKIYGNGKVPNYSVSEQISQNDDAIIQAVYKHYGNYHGTLLSEMTHRTGTPWHQVWVEQDGCSRTNATIPNHLITRYYRQMLDKNAPAVNGV